MGEHGVHEVAINSGAVYHFNRTAKRTQRPAAYILHRMVKQRDAGIRRL